MFRTVVATVLLTSTFGALSFAAPDQATGMLSQVTFDGSPLRVSQVIARLAEAANVSMACDPAVGQETIRIWGKGPAYQVAAALEYVTAGQWWLDHHVWTLGSPLDRLDLQVLASHTPADVWAPAVTGFIEGKAFVDPLMRQLAKDVVATSQGRLHMKWTWAQLPEPDRQLVARICLHEFVAATSGELTNPGRAGPRGLAALGSKLVWHPGPDNFTEAVVDGPGTQMFWYPWGAKIPRPAHVGPAPGKPVWDEPFTLHATNQTLAEIAPHFTPPFDIVILIGDPPTTTATLDQDHGTVHDALVRVLDSWHVSWRPVMDQWALVFGARDPAKLGTPAPAGQPIDYAAVADLPRLVHAAVFEGAPDQTSGLGKAITMQQLMDWFHDRFAAVADSLTPGQKALLAKQGYLFGSDLTLDQLDQLQRALDINWRNAAGGVIHWSFGKGLDLQKVTGEVTADQCTIYNPGWWQKSMSVGLKPK